MGIALTLFWIAFLFAWWCNNHFDDNPSRFVNWELVVCVLLLAALSIWWLVGIK